MTDSSMSGPAGRIMVVDDDRLVLATLATGLRNAGFDVVEADNGDDAILLARKNRPELAMLDMRMQGKTGLDVARYLAAHTDTSFMFLSAFGDPETVQEASNTGALGYLVKPLDIRQIVPAVRAALARARDMKKLKAAAVGEGAPVAAQPAAAGAGAEMNIAVGVFMERNRISQAAAEAHINSRAAQTGKTPAEFAKSIVDAANLLSIG
jgi:two-component system, response regulator PdtaR